MKYITLILEKLGLNYWELVYLFIPAYHFKEHEVRCYSWRTSAMCKTNEAFEKVECCNEYRIGNACIWKLMVGQTGTPNSKAEAAARIWNTHHYVRKPGHLPQKNQITCQQDLAGPAVLLICSYSSLRVKHTTHPHPGASTPEHPHLPHSF